MMDSYNKILIMSFITIMIQVEGARLGQNRKEKHAEWSSLSIVPTTVSPETSGHLLIDPTRLCRKGRKNMSDSMNFIFPGKTGTSRHRRKVKNFCTKEPEVIREVVRGAQLATSECQWQFRNRHWNCSALPRSIRRILARDTRETAFVHSITSAGIAYAVTQACSSGSIYDCPCDRSMQGKVADGFEWGSGCDSTMVGYQRSKDMLDIKLRRRTDIRSFIMLHNNEAGRLAVRNNMRLVCKCHGLSGSCTLKTCWQKVPSFREIGERLKIKFDGGVKVIPGNDGKSVIPYVPTMKKPEKEDLIYFDDSLDFCRHDKKSGSLGTPGRQCNATSIGVDGCDLLCCGRGHVSRVVVEKKHCFCKFKWCCEVECQTCSYKKIVSTCR